MSRLRLLLVACLIAASGPAMRGDRPRAAAQPTAAFSGEPTGGAVASPGASSSRCLACHAGLSPALVQSWQRGRHAAVGIGCFECHRAEVGDPDAMTDHFGFRVSGVVSPRDCGGCHPVQRDSFLASHHARAGRLLRNEPTSTSLAGDPAGDDARALPHPYDAPTVSATPSGNPAADNRRLPSNRAPDRSPGPRRTDYRVEAGDVVIGGVMQGAASVLQGCESCHGTRVEIDPRTGRPLARGWPNQGIGRLNPDGSAGTCSACHQRHDFGMAAVRQPRTCGRCHLGLDHPQLEIWSQSKHALAHAAGDTGVEPGGRPLLLGRAPIVAPTCATCHLGAAAGANLPQTHDPGDRLSWRTGLAVTTRTDRWPEKRLAMQSVCTRCHGPGLVTAHFIQFDRAVELYDQRFARPARAIIDRLRAAGQLSPASLDDPLERSWLALWHHEGRRARMGAAMMGPTAGTQAGFVPLAIRFRYEFLPAATVLAPDLASLTLANPWTARDDR